MGTFGAPLYLLARALEKLTGRRIRLFAYHMVAQPVNARSVLAAGRGAEIEIREAGLEEVLSVPVARPRAAIEARFGQGARCLIARRNGKFLGFIWFVIGPYEEDEVRCRFEPCPLDSSAWDFDVFVEPSARLGVTFARLWDEANRVLGALGVRWTFSRISAFNVHSLASHRRLGQVRLAKAAFLCIGPMQLMFATIRPFLHFGVAPSSRPTLRLRAP